MNTGAIFAAITDPRGRAVVRDSANLAGRHPSAPEAGDRLMSFEQGSVTPTVSVIVPCYNYARFLPQCLSSILNQESVSVSVAVIDDASQDESHEVAGEIARRDRRVEVIRHRANRGHIATYNEGLEWADGHYTVLLSADDLLAPGALSRAASLFARHPGVGLVYGRAAYFADGSPLPAPVAHRGRYHVWTGHDWLRSRCRMGRVQIVSPETMVRTEVQRVVGGYRPTLPHSGDLEMWMRFARVADVGFVCADQAYYRIHGRNMSIGQYGSALVDAGQRWSAFQSALESEPDLLDIARRAMAKEVLWQVCRAYDHGWAGDVPVAEMVDFADSVLDSGIRGRERRAVAWRRRVGPRVATSLYPLTAVAQAPRRLRRLRSEFGPHWYRYARNQPTVRAD